MINGKLLPLRTGGRDESRLSVDVYADVKEGINQYEHIQTDGKKSSVAGTDNWRGGKTQFENLARSRRKAAAAATTATAATATLAGSTKTQSDGLLAPDTDNKTEPDNLKCRLEKDLYMDFEQYKHYTCANCYSLLPDDLFSRKLIFRKDLKGLMTVGGERLVMPNETQFIRTTFKTERTFSQWQKCCEQAVDCCRENSVYLPSTRDSSGKLIDDAQGHRDACPATWDGLSCWPDSPAGRLAKHDCPRHVYFLEFMPICVGQVTKQCFSNASWYIKNDHEWSNYSRCNGQEVYANRMMIGAGMHLFSVIVIGPALLILGKMRHRFGTRRVLILRWLLFWLLLNGLFAALQEIGIILGVFHANLGNKSFREPPKRLGASSKQTDASLDETTSAQRSVRSAPDDNGWPAAEIHSDQSQRVDTWARKLNSSKSKYEPWSPGGPSNTSRHQLPTNSIRIDQSSSPSDHGRVQSETGLRTRRMLEQSASRSDHPSTTYQQSFLIILSCWTVSVGVRITRLFGYAWMFTSAVYLCSVLHFSPAEPPPSFMAWLMFSTHAFPIVIGTTYVIVRSIYDPSPFTLLFELPYYYVRGDMDSVEQLKYTQLDCWILDSNLNWIEDIADWPNAALVLLNTALFVITLIIMCRFKKLPGSTRPETSLWGYFKAAGMLVFLYGAHYLLLAYQPRVEGCIPNQVVHHAMLFIDSIQGLAISLVFCYRTSAGKEVVSKWWSNARDEYALCHYFNLCHRRRDQTNRYQRGIPAQQSSRSEKTTRSSNSVCNGRDMVTELSNVNVNNF